MHSFLAERKSRFGVWVAVAAAVTSLALGARAEAQATTQQSVIVVIIDGARYTETFGDPVHANIPFIWGALRRQGTISTSFYNRGQTVTAGAHASLLSGDPQFMTQSIVAPPYPESGMPRAFVPTLFEYYRAATGAPQTGAWAIANYVHALQGEAYSAHPAYGPAYGASWL